MRDDRGQSAVIDMVIFISIMIIASAIVVKYYTPTSYVSKPESNQIHIEFASDTLNTFLMTTIRYSYYNTTDGQTVHLYDKSISELIVEDCHLRGRSDVKKSSLYPGIERKMATLLYNLTYPQYNYNLSAYILDDNNIPQEDDDHGFYLHDASEHEQNIYSSSAVLRTPDGKGRVLVILRIWLR